jgi:hypothetical protein
MIWSTVEGWKGSLGYSGFDIPFCMRRRAVAGRCPLSDRNRIAGRSRGHSASTARRGHDLAPQPTFRAAGFVDVLGESFHQEAIEMAAAGRTENGAAVPLGHRPAGAGSE